MEDGKRASHPGNIRAEGMTGATMWQLPDEVLVRVFSFLQAEDIGRAASVCSRWSHVAEDRRVWRGKSFLSEGGHGLSDVLRVARALPVLERVSIRRGKVPSIYLDGVLADFKVPDLKEEVVISAISALVTENLSVDFLLLEEQCTNCLLVQLQELKHLKLFVGTYLLMRRTIVAKMRVLSGTLSREPLPNLQSVDMDIVDYAAGADEDVESNILGVLSSCSALDRIAIRVFCTLSCHTATEFSKLKFLQLQDCYLEDISFLDLCPNLHSLSLENCLPLGGRELCRESELRHLILRRLRVNSEFLDTLCRASPKLERILLDECRHVSNLLFLSHCPQLRIVEVNGCDAIFPHVAGIPTGLRHLSLYSPHVSSDSLAEILQGLPQLKILDVLNCNIESLQFLRHCSDVSEMSLKLTDSNMLQHFYELEGLKSLKKLHLHYGKRDVGPLANVLCHMPQLEVLDVAFMETVYDLSFLRYCHRILSLTLRLYFFSNRERMWFHELSNLKELRSLVLDCSYVGVRDLADVLLSIPQLEELDVRFVGTDCNFSFLHHCCQLRSLRLSVTSLSDKDIQLLAEKVLRLPKLKLDYLCFGRKGPNFLESCEWRKILSSLSSKG